MITLFPSQGYFCATAADAFMQRYIVEPCEAADPHARKEPFIRDKGTPVWVVVGYYLGGHSPAQTAAAFALDMSHLRETERTQDQLARERSDLW